MCDGKSIENPSEEGKKEMSTRLNDSVIVRREVSTKVITILRNRGPLVTWLCRN